MTRDQPPSVPQIWAGALILMWALYTVVIAVSLAEAIAAAAMDALANVLPVAGISPLLHSILKGSVMPRPFWQQCAAHLGLAVGFALTWYALVLLLLAAAGGLRGGDFEMNAFSRPAAAWQIFQGLMLYGLIASVCYALRGGRRAASVTIVPEKGDLSRYLTRAGDCIVPIDVQDIVSISGAQDYSEVSTRDGGSHLVKMSLSEFERRLDSGSFMRVHRSTIINFRLLLKVEPAGGGRALVHMLDGQCLSASRAGYQALRSLMV